MQKKFKFFVMAVVAIIAACTVSSCDSDNVDKLTESIWGRTWVSDNGEIYDFYMSFTGVIYDDSKAYKDNKTSKSFIWTINDDRMTFGIDGYREADGEWISIPSEQMKIVTYEVSTDKNKLTLKSADETIGLTLLNE